MLKYNVGDEVIFHVGENKETKSGIIYKIPAGQMLFCIIMDDEEEYKIPFSEIDTLLRKEEYKLGDYVILDFKEYGNISGMIDGVIETLEGKSYSVGIYTYDGEYICSLGEFSNNFTNDYKILCDPFRNEEKQH